MRHSLGISGKSESVLIGLLRSGLAATRDNKPSSVRKALIVRAELTLKAAKKVVVPNTVSHLFGKFYVLPPSGSARTRETLARYQSVFGPVTFTGLCCHLFDS